MKSLPVGVEERFLVPYGEILQGFFQILEATINRLFVCRKKFVLLALVVIFIFIFIICAIIVYLTSFYPRKM